MKLKWILLLFLALPIAARAEGDFRVYSGTEVMIEGGKVDKMSVVMNNYQFNIRPPKGWYREVEESSRKIIFKSPSGKSALTVFFTTNSPDQLPDESELRTRVLHDHAGAGVAQYSVCPTAYRPGVLFDLVHIPAPGVVQKIRHAFLPEPAGTTEIVLTASEDEFEKYKQVFMATARAFRVDRVVRQ